jgi:hypothetical protein
MREERSAGDNGKDTDEVLGSKLLLRRLQALHDTTLLSGVSVPPFVLGIR